MACDDIWVKLWALCFTVASFLACVESNTKRCGDETCPRGLICAGTPESCVDENDVAACNGLGDGSTCSAAGFNGVCSGGVCLAEQCGDGIVNGADECEGTTVASCQNRGFYDEGDAPCDASSCTFDESQCTGECGDGIINGPESCDQSVPSGPSCFGFGFDFGAMRCADNCGLAFDGCTDFGFNRLGAAGIGEEEGSIVATDDGRIFVAGFASSSMSIFDGMTWNGEVSTPCAPKAMWAASSNALWLVGCEEASEHVTFYNGSSFVNQALPSAELRDVDGSSTTNVVVVGDGGAIRHFDGTQWVAKASGTTEHLRRVWVASPSRAYATGTNGLVLTYDGSEWTEVTDATFTDARDVWGTSEDDVYVLDGPLVHHFDGATWSNHEISAGADPGLAAFAGALDGTLFAFGSNTVFGRFDGVWLELDPVAAGNQTMTAGPSGLYVVSAGVSPDVWRYAGAGPTTLPRPAAYLDSSPMGGQLDDLVILDDTLGMTVHFDGQAWTPRPSQGITTLLTDNRGEVWGSNGSALLRQTDVAWDQLPNLAGTSLVTRSSTEIYAVHDGQVYRFNGTSWAPLAGSEGTTLIADLDGTQLLAVAGIELRIYDGNTWIPQALPTTLTSLTQLWADGAGAAAVAIRGSVFHYDGSAWIEYELPLFRLPTALWGTSANDVFASIAGDSEDDTTKSLIHFDGSSWSPVTAIGEAQGGTDRYVVLAPGDEDVRLLVHQVLRLR